MHNGIINHRVYPVLIWINQLYFVQINYGHVQVTGQLFNRHTSDMLRFGTLSKVNVGDCAQNCTTFYLNTKLGSIDGRKAWVFIQTITL